MRLSFHTTLVTNLTILFPFSKKKKIVLQDKLEMDMNIGEVMVQRPSQKVFLKLQCWSLIIKNRVHN
jgi:hypothetical protein